MLDPVTGPGATVLAVDLDGTLLRSDMLLESFWSAFSRDWRTPFRALLVLPAGRAALKRHLAEASDIDVAMLPYDPGVIDYLERRRDAGDRIVLITASDIGFAHRIADHLGLFDEVHGSDGAHNLKGAEKATLLTGNFGEYAYMGDTEADLAVWARAEKAITVNAPRRLRDRVDLLDITAEHLETLPRSVRPYLEALRPHQWLKNLLVFLPLLAAHQLDTPSLFRAVVAFLSFCMIASSVYLQNDLLDLSSDRAHPRKRMRPFASGRLSIAHGSYLFFGLLGTGILLALSLGPEFFLVVVFYYLTTFAYSLALKRRAVVDICVLAGLYTSRVAGGAVAAGVPLSVWLMSFSFFFFFSLATVKRQAELIDNATRGELKSTGRGYRTEDLPIIAMMALASGYISVLLMTLYIQSPEVLDLYSAPNFLGGVCVVLIYWISRMVMLAHRGHMPDDPVVFAARDRHSRVCILICLLFVIAGALF